MSVEFRRPTPQDFRDIEVQPFDEELEPVLRGQADKICSLALTDPGALTCLEDGRVVGIGGIMENHEAWLLLSKDCRRAFLPMVNRIKERFVWHALTYGVVYFNIDPGRPHARRWACALGLYHLEGETWHITSTHLLSLPEQ